MTVGTGMDIVEREVPAELVGRPLTDMHLDAPVVAVIRGGQTYRFDSREVQTLQAGDRVVCLCSNEAEHPREETV
jgi:Trk K+ transport system NAD-binding subunit